jgi:ParB family transcriptional regulator, chromosome partitioning protein
MQPFIQADPFKCRMWNLHSRGEERINADECEEEIRSVRKFGQVIPAIGRRISGDPDFEIELICGARRLFIARHLKTPLLVEICDLSDAEALVAMDIENRARKDISAYERGKSFSRWLQTGQFKSQEELAEVLCISESQVSRLLRLARLPAAVVDAFSSSADIREKWGLDIMDILDQPERRSDILRVARRLASHEPRRPSRYVHRQLLASATGGRKAKDEPHDRVVTDDEGSALFRVRQQSNSVALVLSAEKAEPNVVEQIRDQIAEILQQPLGGDAQYPRRKADVGQILPNPHSNLGL